MKITLNDSEQEIARELARKRYAINRNEGVDNKRIGPQPDDETDLNGIGGEIAFAKMLNLYPDLSLVPRSGGADCIGRDGGKIDVKTTKYPNGRLLATLDKTPEDSDYYVLMVGEFPTYEFVGWARATELLRKENIIDLGHGKTYGLKQGSLKRL